SVLVITTFRPAFAISDTLLGPLSTFFFSSRRRHTRSKRDWSSDVCSSDLIFAYNGMGVLFLNSITGRDYPIVISLVLLYGLIARSEEHTSELQSRFDLVCRLLLEKKKIFRKPCYSHSFTTELKVQSSHLTY